LFTHSKVRDKNSLQKLQESVPYDMYDHVTRGDNPLDKKEKKSTYMKIMTISM